MVLNENEEKFLDLLGIKYKKEEGHFIDDNGNVYALDVSNQNTPESRVSFAFEDVFKEINGSGVIKIVTRNRVKEIVFDNNGQEIRLEEIFQDDGILSTTIYLSTYMIDQQEKYRIYGKQYKIGITKFYDNNVGMFGTSVRGPEKESYITSDLSSMKIVLDENVKYSIFKDKLNIDVYEKYLDRMIKHVCKYNSKVLESFLKMMPLFRLIYDNLEKNLMSHSDEYLTMLANEREKINKEADNEIAAINSRRNDLLQYNYEKLNEFQEFTENNKQKRK